MSSRHKDAALAIDLGLIGVLDLPHPQFGALELGASALLGPSNH
jgi:hypothetical protein